MAAIALFAVACGNDDTTTPEQETAKAVEGSYSGLMSMAVSGPTVASESETSVKITAEADGTE